MQAKRGGETTVFIVYNLYQGVGAIHAISDEPKLTKSHGSLQSSCDVKMLYI